MRENPHLPWNHPRQGIAGTRDEDTSGYRVLIDGSQLATNLTEAAVVKPIPSVDALGLSGGVRSGVRITPGRRAPSRGLVSGALSSG
jgi:hypothetical protein